ncbi:hypothetical protein NIES3275_77410 (plasmid) [Microchaete diplosiphon NIES-3275]|nr:hypothetical protein NIES3275_77410 [Microchaete diplosiphon NIES-3275]
MPCLTLVVHENYCTLMYSPCVKAVVVLEPTIFVVFPAQKTGQKFLRTVRGFKSKKLDIPLTWF